MFCQLVTSFIKAYACTYIYTYIRTVPLEPDSSCALCWKHKIATFRPFAAAQDDDDGEPKAPKHQETEDEDEDFFDSVEDPLPVEAEASHGLKFRPQPSEWFPMRREALFAKVTH